ncbi:hypothetical protein [Aliigemmobacter aestuarii]|uniref:hypothetical protein n=1 Tax=Aliigemmobacter aestuarii TaxID=1445661 RepID=UPI001454DF4F|nr:hypothetical protein [Gemmobacter aestuarii]
MQEIRFFPQAILGGLDAIPRTDAGRDLTDLSTARRAAGPARLSGLGQPPLR